MRKLNFILFILLFFGISSILAADDGFITYFEGEVFIHRNNTIIEAEFGMSVFQKDVLVTKSNSLLIIQLNQRGELKLKEDTILVLDNMDKDTSLVLNQGSVFSRVNKLVNKTFSIRTPSMVAGVRGTEFFVAYGRTIETEPDVWLCVNEGSVDVSITKTGESVLVKEGEGINILSGNKLTKPEFYPWTQDLNWNTDPEKGSVSDTTNLDSAYEDLLNQDYE